MMTETTLLGNCVTQAVEKEREKQALECWLGCCTLPQGVGVRGGEQQLLIVRSSGCGSRKRREATPVMRDV